MHLKKIVVISGLLISSLFSSEFSYNFNSSNIQVGEKFSINKNDSSILFSKKIVHDNSDIYQYKNKINLKEGIVGFISNTKTVSSFVEEYVTDKPQIEDYFDISKLTSFQYVISVYDNPVSGKVLLKTKKDIKNINSTSMTLVKFTSFLENDRNSFISELKKENKVYSISMHFSTENKKIKNDAAESCIFSRNQKNCVIYKSSYIK